MAEFRCPDCGGTEVEFLVLAWQDANTGEIDMDQEFATAVLYHQHRYCRDCEMALLSFDEVDANTPHWRDIK